MRNGKKETVDIAKEQFCNNSGTQQQQTSTTEGRKNPPSKAINSSVQLLSEITIEMKLAVYWQDDARYYSVVLVEHHQEHVYLIHHDDGEVETVDVAKERFCIVSGTPDIFLVDR